MGRLLLLLDSQPSSAVAPCARLRHIPTSSLDGGRSTLVIPRRGILLDGSAARLVVSSLPRSLILGTRRSAYVREVRDVGGEGCLQANRERPWWRNSIPGEQSGKANHIQAIR